MQESGKQKRKIDVARTQIYEQILEELSAEKMTEIQQAVFLALRKAYPQGRTRRQLIGDCFGLDAVPADDEDLNNNGHDRQIRKAISDMFNEQLIPIVSNSGEAGYRIDVSEERIAEMITELASRAARVNEKKAAAERLLRKVRQVGTAAIPAKIAPHPVQLSFVEGAQ